MISEVNNRNNYIRNIFYYTWMDSFIRPLPPSETSISEIFRVAYRAMFCGEMERSARSVESKIFKLALEKWASQGTLGENRQKAKERILAAHKAKPFATELDLEGLGLKSLPRNIGNLDNVVDLVLDDNQLTELPDSIGNMKCLLNLSFKRNQFTSVPKSIENLSELRSLGLSHNKLASLPGSIGNYGKLENLSIAFNQLQALPDTMGNLQQLFRLSLNHNYIQSVPENKWNLPKKCRVELDFTIPPPTIKSAREKSSW